MSRRRSIHAVQLLAVLVGLTLAGGVRPAAGQAPDISEVLLYMPYLNAVGGINGTVKLNGVGQSGVPLKLYFYNGSGWSVQTTTTSGAYGRYTFTNRPSLLPGQAYAVEYLNTANASSYNGRLYFWDTRYLTTYTNNTIEPIGDFDIADITLTGPAAGAGIALPQTFTWNPRLASPSDSYAFELFDADYASPYFEASGLGFIHYYQMSGWPAGFAYNTWYIWSVAADAPDGGYGAAFWGRWLYYAGGSANGLAEAAALSAAVPVAELQVPGAPRPLHALVSATAAP